jgi:hypothetical protein
MGMGMGQSRNDLQFTVCWAYTVPQIHRRMPDNGLDGIFPAHLIALRSGLF